MEREIIFRGKRIDNGEWVTGCYAEFVNYIDGDVKPGIQVTEQVPSGFDRFIPAWETELVEVIPETVGQCTGLKDKNGKLIFDGDVCLHKEYECFGKIKWSLDEACYYFCVCNGYQLFEEEQLYEYVDGLNIIGNIHDNPELLEVH